MAPRDAPPDRPLPQPPGAAAPPAPAGGAPGGPSEGAPASASASGRGRGLAAGVRRGARLGPAERLRQRNDFLRLRRSGRRGGDDVLRLLVGPNGLGWSRVASAVPRRYGKAAARNRLRRLYREAFRLEKEALPQGYDILVSPPRGGGLPDLEAVRASLVRGTRKVVRWLERQPRGPDRPPDRPSRRERDAPRRGRGRRERPAGGSGPEA